MDQNDVTSMNNVASLDAMLDVAKRKLDAQNSQISTLDSKAGFVLGSASLLTAGIAAFQKGAFDAIDTLARNNAALPSWVHPVLSVLVLVAVAVVVALYLTVVWASYHAYKLRDYRAIAIDWDVRSMYLNQQQEKTKLDFLDATIAAVEENTKIIEEKREFTETAVNSLVLEAYLIAGLVVAQALILAFA
ncbi:MAG: hypothetical protein WCD37_14435 [Chloroflexia bacterium]